MSTCPMRLFFPTLGVYEFHTKKYDEWLDSFSIILKFCLGVTSNKGLSNVCFINQRCAPASGNNHVTTVIVWPMRFTNASFKGL